jgi:uncharacterized protein (UPF0335 family)
MAFAEDTSFDSSSATLGSDAKARLRSFVSRIEKLEEDKAAIAQEIKDVFGEAKSEGFDVKALRKAIALRKRDRDEREREEAMLDLYLAALGEV